ncbi:MAG: Gfo/Idh/MocA family oxidoreductase [Anaerolineae bacterium]
MTRKLRFGLIGLGEIAYSSTGHVLRKTANAEMIVGMDPLADIAASYAATFGIPCSTNLDDVLNHPDVDAVIISTPHNLHVPLGIQAARAGKHVIVEKPMATTLEDADALIAACKEAGVLCSSKEGSVRYQPATAKAKELIEQGAIGELMATQVSGASNKPPSYWTGGYTGRVQTTWRKSKLESGGGVLMMNYIYDFYRLRYITGQEIVRVFAEFGTYRTPVEVEDFITLTLRYANGALGTWMASSCAPGASKAGARGTKASDNRIFGTAGQIVFDNNALLVYTDNDVEGLTPGEWTQLSFPQQSDNYAYQVYFEQFAEAVFAGREPDIPCEEGRKTLEVLLAAYRSGETHEPVTLGAVDDKR